MYAIAPMLFLTNDAPPFPFDLNARMVQKVIVSRLNHIQQFYREETGQTYTILPGWFHRGRAPQFYYVDKGAQWSITYELKQEGFPVDDPELALYIHVWGPKEEIGVVGFLGGGWWSPGAGTMMDGPSCIKDYLTPYGLEKEGAPFASSEGQNWVGQVMGRDMHELGHLFGLGHTGGVMSEWWRYGLPGEHFTSGQITKLQASPFLWLK